MKKCKLHSCFIIDVNIDNNKAELIDSTNRKFYVDLSNTDLLNQFKNWLSNNYLSAIPQTLTVFEYEDIGNEIDFYFNIIKFFGIKQNTKILLND